MYARTIDDAISAARVLSLTPTTDGLITDLELRRMGDQVMESVVAELLLETASAFWVRTAPDITLVANQAKYDVPALALRGGVYEALIVDNSGNHWNMPEIPEADRHMYSNGRRGIWRSPFAYSWEQNQLVLLPTPTASVTYYLRLRYAADPNRFVPVSECGKVQTMLAANQVDLGVAPPFVLGATVDLISGDRSGSYLATTTIAGVGATTLTFADNVVTSALVGGYIAKTEHTCVPMMPPACYPVFVSALALQLVQAHGDQAAVALELNRLERRKDIARKLLSPRNANETPRIFNRHSALRGGRYPYGGAIR